MIATCLTCDGRGLRGGLQNKRAAAELGIAKITLQIHRANIMRRMQAGLLAELDRISKRWRSCRANHAKDSALQASAKYDPHVKANNSGIDFINSESTSHFNFKKEI